MLFSFLLVEKRLSALPSTTEPFKPASSQRTKAATRDGTYTDISKAATSRGLYVKYEEEPDKMSLEIHGDAEDVKELARDVINRPIPGNTITLDHALSQCMALVYRMRTHQALRRQFSAYTTEYGRQG